MEFYGVTNLPPVNEPGIHQYPKTGFITIILNEQYKVISENCYCIGVPYIIANNLSNQIELMLENSQVVEKRLSIEFVEEMPSQLDTGKAYILNKDGFQSSFYISSELEGCTIRYKLMVRSSVITTDMLDVMFPVGEIKGLLYTVTNNRWLKPCDGTIPFVPADEYPLYTQLIEDNSILRETFITVDSRTGYKTVKIPNLTNAFPVFVKNAQELSHLIPNSHTSPGQVFEKSTMAKVSFNHNPHNHGYHRSYDSNSKRNDAAGWSGPRANDGLYGTNTLDSTSHVNLDSPNIKHSHKVQVSEGIIAPPHTPLIPHIVIR